MRREKYSKYDTPEIDTEPVEFTSSSEGSDGNDGVGSLTKMWDRSS